MQPNHNQPKLRHIVNLWSLVHYPAPKREWSLERKLRAVKDAGFDGFSEQPTPEHRRWADKLGLILVGYFASSSPPEFERLLRQNKAAGAQHINVQLGDHDTRTEEALELALQLMQSGRKLEVEPAIEVHRDTCTETPEKTYALADAYEEATGDLLPMTWDFSHLAVVKHLAPPFWDRLIVRPDLIQRAQQFHFRPFNGHHCQVPVTDGQGRLTRELLDWKPFARKLLETWLQGANAGRELFVVPEMGPYRSGYNLSTLPNSWEEAARLREVIEQIWRELMKRWSAHPPALAIPSRPSLAARGVWSI